MFSNEERKRKKDAEFSFFFFMESINKTQPYKKEEKIVQNDVRRYKTSFS